MGIKVKVGDKIKMDGEKQRYTVQGVRGRFILATKPFNAQRTYLYTLIDTGERVRGPLNSVFGIFNDVDSPEGATQLFDWIEAEGGWDVWHVSHRRDKPLSEAELAQLVAP
jgi:hypothetical protein